MFRNTKICIRPANILLSDEDVPVLVDFGFAEKYDLGSSKAFRSNLAYGTPEVNSHTSTRIYAPLTANFSTFPQNAPVAIIMTRASLTSGHLELHSLRSLSVARPLSMLRVKSFQPKKIWRSIGLAQ